MGSEKRDLIMVVGSANVDYIMRVPHLPQRGETVAGSGFSQTFGGKGANQAVAAARSGGKVVLVCSLGGDALSNRMLAGFQKDGIQTDYLVQTPDAYSGTALILIDPEGNNCIAADPGANYLLTPQQIDRIEPLLPRTAVLLVQYEIPPETVARSLELATTHGVRTIWNFAPAHSFPFMEKFTQSDLLIVNETEAGFLAGMNPPESDADTVEALYRMHELGAETIILTRGVKGSSVLSEGRVVHMEAFPVKAVDTTAAGDVFCGTLAVGLSEGKPLLEAVRFASAASAISVTRWGAQPSAPYRPEIEEFLTSRLS
ncbi:MAG: ribokinase [Spirochaetes bacterium]|nr:ribokinase [Spirochaetota bacterium]